MGPKTRRGITPARADFDGAPLPRFGLPPEPSFDPSDVAETAERATVSVERARKVIRRRMASTPPPPSADSTQDIAPEDILLEAYADPPSPARTARMLPDLVADEPSVASLDHEVDQLLRRPPALPPRASRPPVQETPSVAPVALAAMHTPVAPFAPFAPPAAKRGISGVLVALALFVSGVTVAAVVVLALLPAHTVERAKASARTLVDRAPSSPSAPAQAVAAPARAPVPAPSPSPAPSPAPAPKLAHAPAADAMPSVPVGALPKPAIPSDTTLVTLPARAAGHRVYVDNVVLPDGVSPAKIRCGKRTIKIGSQGKPREVDLPCGREHTLR